MTTSDYINLTDEERSEIINALQAQAERLNNAGNDRKCDPSVRAICTSQANHTIHLVARLKNAKGFKYENGN